MTAAFSLDHLRPLIIGRGPVRLEAIEVFSKLGITHMGMLLSRKDSFAFPYGMSPEVKLVQHLCQIHLVDDYLPKQGQSLSEFLLEIIQICRQHDYNAVFAGYGFISEHPMLAAAVKEAGLHFIGPSAQVSEKAGAKDAAKQTAAAVGVSVVPGENCLSGLAWLLQELNLDKSDEALADETLFQRWNEQTRLLTLESSCPQNWRTLVSLAQKHVDQARHRGESLVADDWIVRAALRVCQRLRQQHSDSKIRFKAIYGGGGKGQRVIAADASVQTIAETLKQIWIEVGVTAPLEPKNCIIELNLQGLRHWEIQLVGNGHWCVAMGGRDCSIQQHEQKLIEFSLVHEAIPGPDQELLSTLSKDAVLFGQAVSLDSVSTYEAIVTTEQQPKHYFMEMNTRLQVEHRVTELVYGLEFQCHEGIVKVESLIHMMCLLAVYGPELPQPRVYLKSPAALEVRINAMNQALKPTAGGILHSWSPAIPYEIRDDQGISALNPDTGMPVSYAIAGAYDSNLALSLVCGDSLDDCLDRMLHVLQFMRIRGHELELNIPPLLGMLTLMRFSEDYVFQTDWCAQYLKLAALVFEKLQVANIKLSPHRVIAWYFLQDDALLQLLLLQETERQQLLTLVEQIIPHREKPEMYALKCDTPQDILDPPLEQDEGVIKASTNGLFYTQPAPGAPAFIQPGQKVKAGETIGLIEAMKIFHAVVADKDILIDAILVENASQVKKGDLLVRFF